MKLDAQTITILQNFQSINPSIVVDQGNQLKTISPSQAVFARATVPDTFPTKFAIYDISRFLGVLSLMKEYQIDFEETHMNIRSESSKIKYTYCNPSLIITPPDKQINFPSIDVEFHLSAKHLHSVIKAMQVLGFNEIEIQGDGSQLSICAVNVKNTSTDVYSTVLGTTDKNFSAIIECEKLKLIPADYMVTICSKGIAHFKTDAVEYWVALSSKSKFN